MFSPHLFTSIPPRLRGVTIGTAAADSLQAKVIRSWHDAGYRPVSINTRSEHQRHPELRPALEALGVEAVVATGRGSRASLGTGMRCSLLDFLATIEAHASDGPFAITNADIFITPSEDTATWVSRLARHEQLVGQRLDVEPAPDDRDRLTPYLEGFDFFALHRCSLESVRSSLSPQLEIGLPWWDHFLPLALLASSCQPRLVPATAFRHSSHRDRWHAADYCRVGVAAARHFAAALRDRRDPTIPTAWLSVYESLVQPRLATTFADRWLRVLFSRKRPIRLVAARKLQVIAAANVAVLLHAAATSSAATAGDSSVSRSE